MLSVDFNQVHLLLFELLIEKNGLLLLKVECIRQFSESMVIKNEEHPEKHLPEFCIAAASEAGNGNAVGSEMITKLNLRRSCRCISESLFLLLLLRSGASEWFFVV